MKSWQMCVRHTGCLSMQCNARRAKETFPMISISYFAIFFRQDVALVIWALPVPITQSSTEDWDPDGIFQGSNFIEDWLLSHELHGNKCEAQIGQNEGGADPNQILGETLHGSSFCPKETSNGSGHVLPVEHWTGHDINQSQCQRKWTGVVQ